MLNRNAIKQRRYRARQAEPVKMVLKIEAEWARTVEALITAGLLSPDRAWRRDEVELALTVCVEGWVDRVLK